MTAAPSRTTALQPAATSPSALVGVGVSIATIVLIVVVSLVPLVTPLFIHPMLDAAGAAGQLGLDAAATRQASDRLVADLLSFTGSFAFAGPSGAPFLDPSERAHLADARTLLWLALATGALSALTVVLALVRHGRDERRAIWHAVSRGGAVAALGAIAIGVVGALAFDSLFTLFHEVAFPGGNWAFDPTTQRLVQLYPSAFWQLAAAALGLLIVAIGGLTWWLARVASRAPAATTRDTA